MIIIDYAVFQAESLSEADEADKLLISNETRKLVRTLTVLQDYISEYDQLFEQTFFERDRYYLPLIRYSRITVHVTLLNTCTVQYYTTILLV